MRQRLFGSIISIALIAAMGGVAYAWQAVHYRNIPGPITGSYASGIKGSFRFTPVTAPEGIPSAPSGGACIVFRAKDLGFTDMQHKNCKKDGDCETDEGSGYCHLPTGKCWARPLTPAEGPDPDDYLCLRSISPRFPTPVPINSPIEISSTPAPISTPSWNIRHNAKARVLTCLNGIPSGGCGGAPELRSRPMNGVSRSSFDGDVDCWLFPGGGRGPGRCNAAVITRTSLRRRSAFGSWTPAFAGEQLHFPN